MIEIDRYSRTSIYEQLVVQIEQDIHRNVLPSGAALPSVRSLSVQLNINPNTVQKAYSELEKRGLCYAVPGSGRYVTEMAQRIDQTQQRELTEALMALCRRWADAGRSKEQLIEQIQRTDMNGGMSL